MNQDIITDPMLKQHYEVFFLFVALPTQFESVYPYNFTLPSPIYLIPCSTMPLKYLSTCFVSTQCSCLGSTMYFTTKYIYGLLLNKYIKEPINYLYNVRSTNYKSKVVTFFRLVIIGVAIGLHSSIQNLFRI
jgi:hypothetical protein